MKPRPSSSSYRLYQISEFWLRNPILYLDSSRHTQATCAFNGRFDKRFNPARPPNRGPSIVFTVVNKLSQGPYAIPLQNIISSRRATADRSEKDTTK